VVGPPICDLTERQEKSIKKIMDRAFLNI
jgi:hypothetical protein